MDRRQSDALDAADHDVVVRYLLRAEYRPVHHGRQRPHFWPAHLLHMGITADDLDGLRFRQHTSHADL